MILDRGFCSIFRQTNSAAAGKMPVSALTLKFQSWFGELNFENAQAMPDKQRESEVSARIRILQNRSITTHDIAVLSFSMEPPSDAVRFEIVRVYHGIDEESGDLISDISLLDREANHHDSDSLR